MPKYDFLGYNGTMSQAVATLPLLFTVDEVAKIFRLTQAAIRRMIRDKEIPAIKLGKEYRIPQQVVQNILNPLTQANLTTAGFGVFKGKKLPSAEEFVRQIRDDDPRGLNEYLADLNTK